MVVKGAPGSCHDANFDDDETGINETFGLQCDSIYTTSRENDVASIQCSIHNKLNLLVCIK